MKGCTGCGRIRRFLGKHAQFLISKGNIMIMRTWLIAGFSLLGWVNHGLAGGIAYRLPPDGTWAMYRIIPGEYTLEEFSTENGQRVFKEVKLPKAPKDEDLFLVRSVGKVEVDGKPHRWLELVNEPTHEKEKKPPVRVIILKLLVPEAAFRPGHDPLDHVRKMYMSDLRPDGESFVVEVTDDDRRKYELERFRALFPTPPEDPRREEGLSRKTPAGAFEGYELEFDYGYEGRLFAGKRGKNTWNGHYRMFISEDAPFGIVESINERGEGFEDKGDGTGSVEKGSGRMELFKAGTGAESGLPDLK